jgi:hypothetical protein
MVRPGGVHWALAGSRGEYPAGSGAAMRIAPLAFLLDPFKAGDRTIIRDVCRITHHNDEAYVGALAVALSIRSVLGGVWSQQHSFLRAVVDSLPDSAVRDRIEELIQLQLSPSKSPSFHCKWTRRGRCPIGTALRPVHLPKNPCPLCSRDLLVLAATRTPSSHSPGTLPAP